MEQRRYHIKRTCYACLFLPSSLRRLEEEAALESARKAAFVERQQLSARAQNMYSGGEVTLLSMAGGGGETAAVPAAVVSREAGAAPVPVLSPAVIGGEGDGVSSAYAGMYPSPNSEHHKPQPLDTKLHLGMQVMVGWNIVPVTLARCVVTTL